MEVGPSRRVENLAEAREAVEVNAAGRVVMPGFVDAHTHMAFPPAGLATRDADAAERALHTASGPRLEVRMRAYLDALARHGTTTVEVKTGSGLDEGNEAKLLRMLNGLRKDPVDIVASFLFRLSAQERENCREATEKLVTGMLLKIRRRGVAQFADLLWDSDPQLFSCFDRYLAAARELGFPCKVHAEGGAVGAAISIGALHGAVSIDHLEEAAEPEVRQLAGTGMMTTLLPTGDVRKDGPVAPARALIDRGVAVALGSNFNPHLAPGLNMQTVVALACGRLGMTVEEAISAATINSAYALGCADRVGSLEPGKSADLLLLNAGQYQDLKDGLGTNLVHLTMKRGRFIYREGKVGPLTVDELRTRM